MTTSTGLDQVLEYLLLDITRHSTNLVNRWHESKENPFVIYNGRTRVRGTKYKVLEYKHISFVFVTIVLGPRTHFSHITVKTSQARRLLYRNRVPLLQTPREAVLVVNELHPPLVR